MTVGSDNNKFIKLNPPKNKNYDELLFETAREAPCAVLWVRQRTSPVGVGYLCGHYY